MTIAQIALLPGFQSTLPHGERPVTEMLKLACRFQSTLPHGERPGNVATMLQHDNFNPRSRMGSDRLPDHGISCRQQISIHAPAWGATLALSDYGRLEADFNPRSRMGSDAVLADTAVVANFNPRSRMGSDWYRCERSHDTGARSRFQSTLPHGERRGVRRCGYGISIISIHAPAWGATVVALCSFGISMISIHAPAWGAT